MKVIQQKNIHKKKLLAKMSISSTVMFHTRYSERFLKKKTTNVFLTFGLVGNNFFSWRSFIGRLTEPLKFCLKHMYLEYEGI